MFVIMGLFFMILGQKKMALDDDKKPEWTLGDAVNIATPVAGATATAVGKGNTLQGAKTIGNTAWNVGKTAANAARTATANAGGIGSVARNLGGKVMGGAGKVALPVTLGMSAWRTGHTDTEDYAERFGIDKDTYNNMGFVGDLALRTGGALTDVLDTVTLGSLGKHFFPDRMRKAVEEETGAMGETTQARTAQTGATKTARPVAKDINVQDLDNNLQGFSQVNSFAPPTAQQYQGGIGVNNPNYNAIMQSVQDSQKALLENQNPLQGKQIRTPTRDEKNINERKDLMARATTVHKGATGLTANQLRLAHDLTNEDIKMEQERYLQQNNLNHQLAQHNAEQQGQNNRLMASQTADLAKAMMNEQGQNARFNANLGLDVAKFNQDSLNDQYRLGLQGAELQSKLAGDSMDNQVKSEQMSLYNQFLNAKDDDERQKALTNLAVLTGKGGGDDGARYATIANQDGGQSLYNTKTGEIKNPNAQQQPKADWNNEQDRAKIMANAKAIAQKGGTPNEIRQALIAEGVPENMLEQLIPTQGAK